MKGESVKIDPIEIAQHASAVAIVGLATLSFLFNYDLYIFILKVCVVPLFILYAPDLLGFTYRYSREEMKNTKKVSILSSWIWALWGLNRIFSSMVLTSLVVVLFIFLVILSIFYYRNYKKEHLYCKSEIYSVELKRKWKKVTLMVLIFVLTIVVLGFIMIPLYRNLWIFWYTWIILMCISIVLMVIVFRKRNQVYGRQNGKI